MAPLEQSLRGRTECPCGPEPWPSPGRGADVLDAGSLAPGSPLPPRRAQRGVRGALDGGHAGVGGGAERGVRGAVGAYRRGLVRQSNGGRPLHVPGARGGAGRPLPGRDSEADSPLQVLCLECIPNGPGSILERVFDPFLTHFWSQNGQFCRHFGISGGPKRANDGLQTGRKQLFWHLTWFRTIFEKKRHFLATSGPR